MFQAIRTRINATTVLAGLALVFAMTGGAYAAKKYLITSTKQISPSVLKSLQGKAGAPGVQGAAGAAGPVGPQGAGGAAGTKGETGAAGKEGAAGHAGSAGPAGVTGAAGAPGVKGANGTNGATGPAGPAGPTCNEKGECLLPVGATETGVWSYSGGVGAIQGYASISFPLRLAAEPVFTWVGVAQSGTPGAVSGCPGTVTEPKAEAGKLCVYAKEQVRTEPFTPETLIADGTSGITMILEATEEKEFHGYGTWAVKR